MMAQPFMSDLLADHMSSDSRSKSADDCTYSDKEFPEVCAQVCEGQWESEILKKKNCTKNPGHEGFIDISELRLEHLPKRYQNNQILDYINAAADLVVRVMVKYVSPGRPKGYFLADKRGQQVHHYGSGWIISMTRKDSPCPCNTCSTSTMLDSHWAEIQVWTALHLVYDSEEAACTTCDLFYDSEKVRGQCPKLEGVQVVHTEKETDRCRMMCVTHNPELIDTLEQMLARRARLGGDLPKIYRHIKPDNAAVFVVSHPHGCCKQVSWGRRLLRENIKPYRTYYSAPTCSGSSGGYVWIKYPGTVGGGLYLPRVHSWGSLNDNNGNVNHAFVNTL